MSDPLVNYLHDHLAGAAFAIDLLRSLRDHYSGQALGQFASDLLPEVEEDRNTLQRLADHVGKGSADLKQALAWVAEKVARMKLSHTDAMGFGTFQAVETLALGILGKLALWRTLIIVAETDDRVRGANLNLEQLISRAQAQHAKAEENRLLLANTAFSH